MPDKIDASIHYPVDVMQIINNFIDEYIALKSDLDDGRPIDEIISNLTLTNPQIGQALVIAANGQIVNGNVVGEGGGGGGAYLDANGYLYFAAAEETP